VQPGNQWISEERKDGIHIRGPNTELILAGSSISGYISLNINEHSAQSALRRILLFNYTQRDIHESPESIGNILLVTED